MTSLPEFQAHLEKSVACKPPIQAFCYHIQSIASSTLTSQDCRSKIALYYSGGTTHLPYFVYVPHPGLSALYRHFIFVPPLFGWEGANEGSPRNGRLGRTPPGGDATDAEQSRKEGGAQKKMIAIHTHSKGKLSIKSFVLHPKHFMPYVNAKDFHGQRLGRRRN